MGPGKLLEMLRDRVIHRSQIGRRRLDRVATRRRLDEALLELGRRYRLQVEAGQVAGAGGAGAGGRCGEGLEQRLAEQEQDLAALEKEHPSGR